ncbi:unnamed protein product [[Candida] boidinii]|uniref:Unnamed protein product n=1 Tax=Candida boidinii TaxID=5477 RepID=A0A9W6T424_CANBO|nr:unnamed protein product [[Candida] boidinii]
MSGAGSTTDMSGNKGSSFEKKSITDDKSDENKISENNSKETKQGSTTSLTSDNNTIDKDSKENNNSVNKAKFTMDRIRLESIERRRQECSNVIKGRKRKLAELYCVSRLPLLPISNDQVLQIEDKLMAFLEKNDLENGHEFNISVLMREKQRRAAPASQIQQSQHQESQLSQSGQQPQVLATDKQNDLQQLSALQKSDHSELTSKSQLADPTSNVNSELDAKKLVSLANGRPLVTDKPSQEYINNNTQSTGEPPKKLQKLSNVMKLNNQLCRIYLEKSKPKDMSNQWKVRLLHYLL